MAGVRTDVLVTQAHYMTIIPYNEPIFTKKGKLNGINTYRDWKLLPSSRPVFNPPKVKTNYIDLPGADGSIDATDIISGYPVYSNREGSNEFYVITGYGNWANRFSDIMDYLHGQKVKVILETDPSYYYEGRLSVNEWRSEKDHSKIVIDYNLDPYKYEIQSTTEKWLWDPFSFYDGIIRYQDLTSGKGYFTDIVLYMGDPSDDGWKWDPFNFPYGKIYDSEAETASLVLSLVARSMPVVPVFTIKRELVDNNEDAEMTIIQYKKDGTTVDVAHTIKPTDNKKHKYKFPDIILRGVNNKLEFVCGPNSKFIIDIDYRCGRL